ncbi:chitin synthase [Synchytrium endobioticum]|uniref:chitin synthase n=1 Tax=Synchytrium endobioticum TaxID=286115 RepID=A0A507D8I9_9FUNG|nr:chitin synthase [Synchytrium endobioticum]
MFSTGTNPGRTLVWLDDVGHDATYRSSITAMVASRGQATRMSSSKDRKSLQLSSLSSVTPQEPEFFLASPNLDLTVFPLPPPSPSHEREPEPEPFDSLRDGMKLSQRQIQALAQQLQHHRHTAGPNVSLSAIHSIRVPGAPLLIPRDIKTNSLPPAPVLDRPPSRQEFVKPSDQRIGTAPPSSSASRLTETSLSAVPTVKANSDAKTVSATNPDTEKSLQSAMRNKVIQQTSDTSLVPHSTALLTSGPSPMLVQSSDSTSIQLGHQKPVDSAPRKSESSGRNETRTRKTMIKHRTLMRKKTIRLTAAGHLAFEVPVPERYLEFCKYKEAREFTFLRYTAVTHDPDEVGRSKLRYEVRQNMMKRDTELAVCVTMYNEDEVLFAKTMTAIMKNIEYMCSDQCHRTWGPEGWRNAVVVIVADGRKKIHKRVLAMLGLMGLHQDLCRSTVDGRPVTAHWFELTTQVSVDKNMRIRGTQDGVVPVQVLFCLKEHNAKKLNSHRWFFNGICPLLKPNVCCLIDVGTKPTSESLYHLWRAFDRDSHVGGACGEICVESTTPFSMLNPLVASQNFEYKMSNILDKPLESVLGYIQVLPGAFSAYRYEAVQNTTPTSGPLVEYFKGEVLHHGADFDVSSTNKYLAEDRILCFEVVTKVASAWTLKYVKAARAETDVPNNLPELVSQRRRWLNGSLFALIHAISHYDLFFRSSHSAFRKVLFTFLTIYNIVNLIFTWFSIGNFYLTFFFLSQVCMKISTDPFRGSGPLVFLLMHQLYVSAFLIILISSFGNRPQGSKLLYYAVVYLFALVMVFTMFIGFLNVTVYLPAVKSGEVMNLFATSDVFRGVVLAVASTYGMYLVSSLIFLDFWHMITSCLPYMLLLPTYVNLFMVYSLCNIHDVSWGTKGDNVQKTNVEPIKHDNVIREKREELEVVIPDDDRDNLNTMYDELVAELRVRPLEKKPSADAKVQREDYFKLFRTRIVIAWLLSNGLLITIFTTTEITSLLFPTYQISPYLIMLFWAVTGLAAVRFAGAMIFVFFEYSWAFSDYILPTRKFDGSPLMVTK